MIELSVTQYLIALTGSFLAGAINTLAGNGSVITLSILTDVMGMPANLANATNRVGIFLQSAGSVTGFAQHKQYQLQKSASVILLTLSGAVLGVLTAIWVSNEQFLFVFRYLMLFMLVVILVKPERWLHENEQTTLPMAVRIPVFLLLGFYGGFIQMGMGIFFLAVLVLLSGYSLMEANVVKTWVILIYTALVLALFALNGMVNWKAGLVMAAGQVAGGFLTARYAPAIPEINTWAYYLLVIIVLVAVLIQFKLISI
jgi:uncharacterized membrane protein YfcA